MGRLTTKSASDFLEAVVEIGLHLTTILGGDTLASLENMAQVKVASPTAGFSWRSVVDT